MPIKKFFFIIFFLIASMFSFAESEFIDTELGQVEIYIPETYQELKQNYIDIIKLYIQQKNDLEISVKNNDQLLQSTKDLISEVEKLISLNREAIKLLDLKNTTPLIQSLFFTNFQYNVFDFSYSIGIGYGVLVFDKVYLSAGVNLPLEITIQIGIKF